MGWNDLERTRDSRLLDGLGDRPYVYFANSYYAPENPAASARGTYGVRFTAMLEHGNVCGVQFHPEKSGPTGLRIVAQFHRTMLAKRIIPCLDVTAGRVVKGVKFLNLRDAGDPVELADRYNQQGADELVFLDITASSDAREIMADVVQRTARRVFIPLTVGGGIRSVADARTILLSGADKVSINTAAIRRPELIHELSRRIRRAGRGSGDRCAQERQQRGTSSLAAAATTKHMDAVEWAQRGAELGAGEILLTSMDTDGVRTGLRLRSHARRRRCHAPFR